MTFLFFIGLPLLTPAHSRNCGFPMAQTWDLLTLWMFAYMSAITSTQTVLASDMTFRGSCQALAEWDRYCHACAVGNETEPSRTSLSESIENTKLGIHYFLRVCPALAHSRVFKLYAR